MFVCGEFVGDGVGRGRVKGSGAAEEIMCELRGYFSDVAFVGKVTNPIVNAETSSL